MSGVDLCSVDDRELVGAAAARRGRVWSSPARIVPVSQLNVLLPSVVTSEHDPPVPEMITDAAVTPSRSSKSSTKLVEPDAVPPLWTVTV